MNDQEHKKLIRDLRKGDVFSFDEIYKMYNRKIFVFSMSYLKNKEEAEELVQDVFLNIWRNRAILNEQKDFNAFLFTVTFNTIRQHFRSKTRERKHHEEYGKTFLHTDDTTNASIEYKNLLDLAETAIERLPRRQREVYQMKIKMGISNAEIGSRLGISRRTVENHLQRARNTLKKVLTDQGLISLLFFWLFIQ